MKIPASVTCLLINEDGLTARAHRMLVYIRAKERRNITMRKYLNSHGNLTLRDNAAAASLFGYEMATVCFLRLYSGLKIMALLKRNLREGQTRGFIIHKMMMHVLGERGDYALAQMLPYMNLQTWDNYKVFRTPFGVHTSLQVMHDTCYYLPAVYVAPARNVNRSLVF